MKKIYVRPSMDVNTFDSMDITSIGVQSAVAITKKAGTANQYGISLLDLDLKS